MAEFPPGTVFAGHRIEALAGRGGMGVVYRATHLSLGRTVALKVIAPTLVEESSAKQRFLRESKLAASIDHPHVIPVYYTGEEDGVAYIAMRYVPGDDLRSLVRTTGPLAPRRAARIISQAAAALDAAHATGLIHRDVKPANVLLGQAEHVYLSDFGLSKHTLSMDGETRSGHWVGTLDYVAPEQIRGERLDARADVYALGCVLHFALTGSAPFPHEGDEAKLWAHLREPPPAPSEKVPELPPELDGVIGRALAKRAVDRYPSAGDLGRAAVAAAEHDRVRERERFVGVGAAAPEDAPTESGGAVIPPSEAQTVIEPRRRKRAPPAVVVGALLGGLVVAVVALALGTGGGDEPPSRDAASTTPTATATAFRPKVVGKVRVGGRPNGIAVGHGIVFVTSFSRPRVALIDEAKVTLQRPGQRPRIGTGSSDVEPGTGSMWVVNNRRQAVYSLDPATGRERRRITLPARPRHVAAGHGALWVGTLAPSAAIPDTLVRIDPHSGRITGSFPVPEGINRVLATPAGIWVTHRRDSFVARFDPRSERFTRAVRIGSTELGDAAYGDGAVWVTSPLEDTVSRIDDQTGKKVSSGVGRRPVGIGASGREVWVTSLIDHTITRIDPRSGRPTGDPIPVPLNPYAIAVTHDSVWLTAIGHGDVIRVRYRDPR